MKTDVYFTQVFLTSDDTPFGEETYIDRTTGVTIFCVGDVEFRIYKDDVNAVLDQLHRELKTIRALNEPPLRPRSSIY